MKSSLFAALALVFIPLSGCTLLAKKQTRNPQGIGRAFKLLVKAGNEVAKALRKGEKDMEGENLQGAHLQNLNFEGVNFKNADLEEARLQGTIWKGAEAQGANFRKCRCQGADFRGVTSLREGIVKAIFKKAKLQRAKMLDLDLQNLDFRGANVKGTEFYKSKFYGADLRGIKNWEEAKWEGAVYNLDTKFPDDFNPRKYGMWLSLRDANLQGQDFSGWDLSNARIWAKTNLEGATFDSDTKFPGRL